MKIEKRTLERKALATAMLLVQTMAETQFIEGLSLAAEQICRDARGPGSRLLVINDEDRICLSFEVTCFAAFLIMGQEAPKFITLSDGSGKDRPDEDGIQYFNTKLLEYLEGGLSEFKRHTASRETATNYATRLCEYLRSGSPQKEVELFGRQVALSLDEGSYPFLKILGMRYVGPLVDLIRSLLTQVFDPTYDARFWNNESLFDKLEQLHGNDYEAMIGQIQESFGRTSGGKVMLFPEELTSALDHAFEAPSKEAWFRLKAALLKHRKR